MKLEEIIKQAVEARKEHKKVQERIREIDVEIYNLEGELIGLKADSPWMPKWHTDMLAMIDKAVGEAEGKEGE
jgi:arginine deiminase